MALSQCCNTAEDNHKKIKGTLLLWGLTLALFPLGKWGFTLQVTVGGGGSKDRASMAMPSRAGDLARTEARSGGGAQQRPVWYLPRCITNLLYYFLSYV